MYDDMSSYMGPMYYDMNPWAMFDDMSMNMGLLYIDMNPCEMTCHLSSYMGPMYEVNSVADSSPSVPDDHVL